MLLHAQYCQALRATCNTAYNTAALTPDEKEVAEEARFFFASSGCDQLINSLSIRHSC